LARLLKFVSIFLGVALIIFLLVFGLNREALLLVIDNRQALADGSEWVEKTYSMNGLAQYVSLHPEQVSIHSRNLDPDGDEISFGGDKHRSMGMISSFFLLTAYADGFDRGDTDPDERISWNEIEQFQLPRIGANELQLARRTARNHGQTDPDGFIRLADALPLLVSSQSPALFDYLLFHLGIDAMESLYRRLEVEKTDLPVPFSGLFLTLAPSIHQVDAETIISHWQQEPRESFEAEAWANALTFFSGDNRQQWQKTIEKERLGLNFLEQRELLTLYSKTTPREITRLLEQMLNGELLSEATSRRVESWLHYPVQESHLRQNFIRYGALYDSRLGLLNGIDFGTDHNGTTRLQAVFFDQIHLAVWFHVSSNHMHQDFQQRLIWDTSLYQTLKQALHNTNS